MINTMIAMPEKSTEVRQPKVNTIRPTRGAMVPPSPSPIDTMDMARPRRRRNQLLTAAMEALL